GNIVWEAGYQVWGNLTHEKETRPVQQNLRFQGQYLDRETGLHYNLYRFYDPDIGKFISGDPIGLAGGINLYQYAPNPLSWIDPLGLCKTDSAKQIAGKITGYTRHGLNQAIGRNGGKGVNIKDMLDAVQNPKKIIENANGTIKYQGKRATVVLNQDGKVVTVFGKSRGPEIWP
ncbi:TPA: RHS repeat-associated core domain-containing protein, partial [Salmonella enterica]